MRFSNGVEKYEIEVTKMDQNYPLFLTVWYEMTLRLFGYAILRPSYLAILVASF